MVLIDTTRRRQGCRNRTGKTIAPHFSSLQLTMDRTSGRIRYTTTSAKHKVSHPRILEPDPHALTLHLRTLLRLATDKTARIAQEHLEATATRDIPALSPPKMGPVTSFLLHPPSCFLHVADTLTTPFQIVMTTIQRPHGTRQSPASSGSAPASLSSPAKPTKGWESFTDADTLSSMLS